MKSYGDSGLGIFPDYEEPEITFIPSYKRTSNFEEEKQSYLGLNDKESMQRAAS